MTRELSDMAFPAHGSMGEVVNYGMTLRDYFAAKAMQGLIPVNNVSQETIAKAAYSFADAMIEARK